MKHLYLQHIHYMISRSSIMLLLSVYIGRRLLLLRMAKREVGIWTKLCLAVPNTLGLLVNLINGAGIEGTTRDGPVQFQAAEEDPFSIKHFPTSTLNAGPPKPQNAAKIAATNPKSIIEEESAPESNSHSRQQDNMQISPYPRSKAFISPQIHDGGA